MMQWMSTNADEHVLCDPSGRTTEYRIRRDPISGLYRAYDGQRRILERPSIYPCRRECETRYAAERVQAGTWKAEKREAARGKGKDRKVSTTGSEP